MCAAWLAAKTYLWSREIKTLEDSPGKLTVVVCFSRAVIQQGIAAVARAINRTGLLFRHILDRYRVSSRVSSDAEGGNFVVKAMTDIVKGVDDLERTLGQSAGILDRNQNAVEDPAGGQSPAAKIIALAASGQNNEYKAG